MGADRLTILVLLRAKPGQEARVQKELEALLAPTRAEEGCINFDLHVSKEEPGLFMVHENWEGEEYLNRHFETPHIKRWLVEAESLLAEPMQLTRWRPEG